MSARYYQKNNERFVKGIKIVSRMCREQYKNLSEDEKQANWIEKKITLKNGKIKPPHK